MFDGSTVVDRVSVASSGKSKLADDDLDELFEVQLAANPDFNVMATYSFCMQ